MKIKVYNIDGKKAEDLEVSEAVFGVKANDDLIHQVYVAQSSNKRAPIAHTKTRGERAGSGIKPWRQKGTGRARVGSVRNPAWKKGGVAFGPRSDRNFRKLVNQKMNSNAIKMVLSGKVSSKELVILKDYVLKSEKTKEMVKMLKNLKISGNILMAFSDSEKGNRKLSRNISNVSNIMVLQLNIYDMLNNKFLILTKDSIKFLEKKYGK